uniref:EF-hand domain-containing protein n=1 Tax=Alexandrium catenella TaxID=2925 RepID=A0A7S1WDC0_ALECA
MARRLATAALQSARALVPRGSAGGQALCLASASQASRAVASRSATVAFGAVLPLRAPAPAAFGGGSHAGCRIAAQPASSSSREAQEAGDAATTDRDEYNFADVARWRSDFGFSRRQHSLASFGYTDDELLEWRKPFDALADPTGSRIAYAGFEKLVLRVYHDVISDEQLQQKVRYFWEQFDADKSDFVDFGEFINAGLLFNVDFAKEKIRKDGIEATFMKYAEDSFMAEPHFMQLMSDHHFFAVTTTDVHKLVSLADQDHDGLVSLSDFVQWIESEDRVPAAKLNRRRRRAKGGAVAPPPPEPEG